MPSIITLFTHEKALLINPRSYGRMSVQISEINIGDILIGQNLLIGPALLLEQTIDIDEGSLLDFCTLVKALTLHDRIITLPSKVPKDLRDTQLYKYLAG